MELKGGKEVEKPAKTDSCAKECAKIKDGTSPGLSATAKALAILSITAAVATIGKGCAGTVADDMDNDADTAGEVQDGEDNIRFDPQGPFFPCEDPPCWQPQMPGEDAGDVSEENGDVDEDAGDVDPDAVADVLEDVEEGGMDVEPDGTGDVAVDVDEDATDGGTEVEPDAVGDTGMDVEPDAAEDSAEDKPPGEVTDATPVEGAVPCEGVYTEAVSRATLMFRTPVTIGGYSITYDERNATGIEVDVACAATGASIVENADAPIGVATVIPLPLDGLNAVVFPYIRNYRGAVADLSVE